MELSKLNIKILSKEVGQGPENFRFEMFLSEESGFFKGHFPEFPLLPGVVQINLVMALFSEHFSDKVKFLGFRNVKFFSPLFPQSKVILQISYESDLGRIHFEYKVEDRACSKGTVEVARV